MGAPLQLDKERNGWVYSEESWALPTTFVTEGELLAFFLAVEIAKRQMSGAVHLSLINAIEKIARALQGRVEIDLQALQDHYSFALPTSAHVEEEHLTMLHEAIRRQHVVAFDYLAFTTGKREGQRVHPHLLHHSQGDWYLLAFDEARRALRTFNLDRIDHLRVLALLDAEFTTRYDENDRYFYREGGAMSYRLLQIVRLSASKNVGVNWPVLLADLCSWDDAHKAVQKKWARNFFDFRDADLPSSDQLETPDKAAREYSHAAANQPNNGEN